MDVDNSFRLFCYCHFVIREDRNRSARFNKTSFPRAKFTTQVFCSFLSAPMCGKSRKHSFNTEVVVDSSISRAWTPLAISLSDRNDPL